MASTNRKPWPGPWIACWSDLDLVLGSRFHPDASIAGLSAGRQRGSERANQLAALQSSGYAQLTDYMSGFFAYGQIAAVKPSAALMSRVQVPLRAAGSEQRPTEG